MLESTKTDSPSESTSAALPPLPERGCVLGKTSCSGCQYRTRDRSACYHPSVSGLSIEEIIEIRANEKKLDVEKAVKAASKRIQSALVLDQYSIYIRSKYGVRKQPLVESDRVMAVLGKGLLWQLHARKLIASLSIITDMLSVRRWDAFKSLSDARAGDLHDVAELNLAALILLNQQVPTFRQ